MKSIRVGVVLFTSILVASCATQTYGVIKDGGRHIEHDELMKKAYEAESISEKELNAATRHQTMSDDGVSIEIIKSPMPKYPKDLMELNIQGVVEISFIIDKTGRVRDARVISSPAPKLSENCLNAIRKWRFRPVVKDGIVVEYATVQSFPFIIGFDT